MFEIKFIFDEKDNLTAILLDHKNKQKVELSVKEIRETTPLVIGQVMRMKRAFENQISNK